MVTFSMTDPQVRSNWPKFVLRWTKRLNGPNGAPIVDAVPSDLRREIREVPRFTWYDARLLTDLTDVVHRACGSAGARAFWRASFLESITQPMMAPLARGALMLWGNTPDALVRRTPQAWQFVTRECGNLKAVTLDEPNAIILRFEGLPRIFRNDGFISMGVGGLESEIAYFHLDGTVETQADHLMSRGAVDFAARWQPKR